MFNKVLKLAGLSTAVLLTACASNYSTMHQVQPSLQNNSAEYNVLERVTGTAECQKILIFEVGESDCGGGMLAAIFGSGETAPVEQKAMTRAVDSIPKADAMLAPRFTYVEENIPLIMVKRKVSVTGKAVEFK